MAAPHLNSSPAATDDGVADRYLGKRDVRSIHYFSLTAGDRQPRIAKCWAAVVLGEFMRQAERTLQQQRSDGPPPAGVPAPIGHSTEIFARISKLKRLPICHWFDLREAMGLRVRVRDPEDGQRYRFTSDSLHSYQRARALFSKDSMIAQGEIRSPDLIKIDTDGIEIQIVTGMKILLSGQQKPRSVLVEVQRGELQTQREFMRACGYSLVEGHLIGRWKRVFQRGQPLEELTLNAVFEPVH